MRIERPRAGSTCCPSVRELLTPTTLARRRILKGKPLRRRVAFRTPKRTFLVFCEGRRTEPDYLKARKQEPAVRDVASVDIRIAMDANGIALPKDNPSSGMFRFLAAVERTD